MTLQPHEEHPHGLTDHEFDALFTTDKPVIFVHHGYPWLIHRLTYRRTNHDNFHVRGYKEEGTTTTPFDMVVLNQTSRYDICMDAIRRSRRPLSNAGALTAECERMLDRHRAYIAEHLEDMPEIRTWTWAAP